MSTSISGCAFMKSSAAMCVAVTDPMPVPFAFGPFRSVRTPIRMVGLAALALRSGTAAAAVPMASADRRVIEEVMTFPFLSGPHITAERAGVKAGETPATSSGRLLLLIPGRLRLPPQTPEAAHTQGQHRQIDQGRSRQGRPG